MNAVKSILWTTALALLVGCELYEKGGSDASVSADVNGVREQSKLGDNQATNAVDSKAVRQASASSQPGSLPSVDSISEPHGASFDDVSMPNVVTNDDSAQSEGQTSWGSVTGWWEADVSPTNDVTGETPSSASP